MIKILSIKILSSMKQSCIKISMNVKKPKNFFLGFYQCQIREKESLSWLEDNEKMRERGVRMAEKYKNRQSLREHGHAPGSMRIPEARKWVDENFR